MADEHERKFLLENDDWRPQADRRVKIIQGYLVGQPAADNSAPRCSVRIRITEDEACINIKSMTLGISRKEYEYHIPMADAEYMLETLCVRPLLEKTRHYVPYAGHIWEVDEFAGDNAGLIVAELELKRPDESFDVPAWLGTEVSADPRYYNVCLINHPYKNWSG